MAKLEGLVANMGMNHNLVASLSPAKIERSLYFLIISSWSRRKAFWPSLQIIGILILRIPRRLYDISSILVVWCLVIQDIRAAIGNSWISFFGGGMWRAGRTCHDWRWSRHCLRKESPQVLYRLGAISSSSNPTIECERGQPNIVTTLLERNLFFKEVSPIPIYLHIRVGIHFQRVGSRFSSSGISVTGVEPRSSHGVGQ